MSQRVPERYSRRFSLTVTPEQDLALKHSRVMDRIQGTYRIRAMIELWMTNSKFRAEVDELALKAQQTDDLWWPR